MRRLGKNISWPHRIIQVECGKVGSCEPADGGPEPGDIGRCKEHGEEKIVLVAWLDPVPTESVKDWGKQFHLMTSIDYLIDYGMPGVSFSEDGHAIVVFSGERAYCLRRAEQKGGSVECDCDLCGQVSANNDQTIYVMSKSLDRPLVFCSIGCAVTWGEKRLAEQPEK